MGSPDISGNEDLEPGVSSNMHRLEHAESAVVGARSAFRHFWIRGATRSRARLWGDVAEGDGPNRSLLMFDGKESKSFNALWPRALSDGLSRSTSVARLTDYLVITIYGR